MTLQTWAELNGLNEVYWEYRDKLANIIDDCVKEGYPSHGSNFESRAEQLRKDYPELFS